MARHLIMPKMDEARGQERNHSNVMLPKSELPETEGSRRNALPSAADARTIEACFGFLSGGSNTTWLAWRLGLGLGKMYPH